MFDISITKKDETYITVNCENSIARELTEFFTFEVPNARFSPAFKAGKWDGRLRIFKYGSRTIYLGLADHVRLFAEQRGYSFQNKIVARGTNITREEVDAFTDSLDYHAYNEKIELTEYQKEAIYQCLCNDRLLLISPTSSGKSAMVAGIVRWHLKNFRKCLILVPTTALVSQMKGDFHDYFKNSGWSADENCHCITGGVVKNSDKDIVISTWQSIFEQDEKYFSQFDCVIVDECHTAAAKSLTGIMEKCKNTPFRIGCTGTLDESQTNKLVLIGLFGRLHQTTTTKELMDDKVISELKVNCIFLQYPQEDKDKVIVYDKAKKKRKCIDYADEIDFIISHEKRNKFIRNLAVTRDKNTLILFNRVEHGKTLYDAINSKVEPGRKVYLIHGKVDADVREEIRSIVERESNAIILASYGTTQAGVSIRNIHYVIFASPSKSRVRVLQSIGRGLRKNKDKDYCTLFDISDDLSVKKMKNHTLKHAVIRINTYNEEGFNYKMTRVDLV